MAKYNVVVHSLLVNNPDVEENILSPIDAKITFVPDENREEFFKALETADAAIIADRKVGPEAVEKAKNLKIIARQGIGFDNIDLVKTKERGIAVTNVPDYCVDEVSDFAMSLMFSLLRHVPSYDKHVKDGVWDINSIHDIDGFPKMRRLNTQTLGIVGFGKIAREVARKAKAFGFKMLAYDPYVPKDLADQYGVELVDLDTIVREADVITIHSPLTPETKHMFNLETFKKMKRTAIVVNTSRGPLIKEEDLCVALKEKLIAGAAIDVTEVEPPVKGSSLLSLDNLIITPHAAFFTKDSYDELRRRAAEEVRRVLLGEEPQNRVNK